MPVLQDGVMATLPSWEELSDVEKADRVAKRLLGPPKVAEGSYLSVQAAEDMCVGDPVTTNGRGIAERWNGVGMPSGIAICPLKKGYHGWILTKS